MESHELPGSRMFPNVGTTTQMLGLEMPLHNRNPPPPPQPTTTAPQMVVFSGHNHNNSDPHPQTQLSMRQSYSYPPQAKHPSHPTSDDDENGSANEDGGADPKRKTSPWQRMKWTDTMVKLLIMAVYYIGDEAGTSSDGAPESKKAKSSAAQPQGLLQKKGKWKSVSKAMMEKGYRVSPQQCEDKFNDLNKRYKRVNDILGRGTACRVVENQSLLETMDLPPKMKEEVRKLLNSKHLFFREMCAYHNSCGHGSVPTHHHHHHHSPESALRQSPTLPMDQIQKKTNIAHQEEDDEEVEDEDEEDQDSEEDDEETEHWNRGRESEQLKGEMMGVIGDGSKTAREKRQWMMGRLMQLEETRVKYQYEAFKIEKQRFKWAKFSSNKEREIESMKIDIHRRLLDNERMLLLLRQKELETLDYQQQQQPDANPSTVAS